MPVLDRHPATAAVLSAWFVSLLVPTVALKLAYLWTMTGGDLAMLQPSAETETFPWRLVMGLMPADLIDVALAVAALYLVGGALSWRVGRILATLLVGVVLVAGAAGLIGLRETGALPSRDSWLAGIHWLAANPELARHALSVRALILLGLAITWLPVSIVLPYAFDRFWIARARGLRFAIPLLLVATVTAAVIAEPSAVLARGTSGMVRRGFWRSVILAFSHSDARAPHAWALPDAGSRIAWPREQPPSPSWLVDLPVEQRRPRHLVLVTLETAPRSFYNLERPELPAFRAMTTHAIVADAHHTSAPMTSLAVYSLLTGMYPPESAGAAARLLRQRPDLAATSLVGRLHATGYETSFFDSYDLTWNGPDEARVLAALGFDTIADARTMSLPRASDPYSDRLARDSQSFARALERIRAAASRGHHAFVTIATHLGHYDWPAPPDAVPVSAPADRLLHVARGLDRLLGDLLTALGTDGLIDDTIVVVTGDHGLRFRLEFDALEEAVSTDATFHVPMLIYAPGLVATQVRVPYVTSHIDLAPTLLDLTGTSREETPYHGANLLDRRMADRITFLPSGAYPGLRPVDALHWRGVFNSYYEVVDRVTMRRAGDAAEAPLEHAAGDGLSVSDVKRLLGTRTAER